VDAVAVLAGLDGPENTGVVFVPERREEAELTERMLAGLPERYAHVLSRLYRDAAAVEVGAEMGVTDKRVHQIRDRALEALRSGQPVKEDLSLAPPGAVH
jgi:DNA-directed RNA polymerase sigma subunit (sigma70/sigma32)